MSILSLNSSIYEIRYKLVPHGNLQLLLHCHALPYTAIHCHTLPIHMSIVGETDNGCAMDMCVL